jgi:hypothetical protein
MRCHPTVQRQLTRRGGGWLGAEVVEPLPTAGPLARCLLGGTGRDLQPPLQAWHLALRLLLFVPYTLEVVVSRSIAVRMSAM